MKKMIALLLALMMAMCCLQAVAEAPADAVAAEAPAAASTTKMELSIDKELVKGLIAQSGDTEGSENLIDAILDLVDALEITVVGDGSGAQIDLGFNGNTAVSLGLEEKDGGLLIATTLIPNYMLTIPAETIQNMMPQFTSAATTEDGTGTSAMFSSAGSISEFIDALRKIDPELTVSITANGEGINIQFEQGGQYFALSLVPGENNTLALNVYVIAKEKPMATLTISEEKAGVRTLSMDPEGKTVLSVNDLQGENAATAMEGLQTDLQMGIMQLMAVPEVANVMAVYSQMMQQQMQQQMQQETGEPAEADTVPANP